MKATFYFDPSCPWTWRASRWLTRAAAARGVTVRWRPFSLSILNEDPPEQYRATMAAARRALRLIAALAENGGDGTTGGDATTGGDVAIGRFYTELGARSHERDEPLTDDAVDGAADAAGLGGRRAVLDDESWDKAVAGWHREAWESAGPDVGSPVLWLAGAPRGLHGPILAEVPPEAEAAQLFDALLPLLRSETFYEVKRGRR